MIYGTSTIISNGLVGYFDVNNHKSYTSGSLFWKDLTGTCDIELTGSNIMPVFWNGINDPNSAIVALPYNGMVYSETFTNSTWNKTRTGYSSSITASAIEGPPGLFGSGSKLNETVDNSKHAIIRSINLPIGDAVTFSFYAKAAERSWVYWENTDWATTATVSFNLATGQTGSITNGGTANGVNMNPFSASIESVGDGWYRCSVRTSTGWDSVTFTLGIGTGDSTRTYAGTPGSGVYIYGAQADYGTTLKPYIPMYDVSSVYNNSSFLKYTGSSIQANNDFSAFMWVRGHFNPGFYTSNFLSKWSLSEGGFIFGGQTTLIAHSSNTSIIQNVNLNSYGNARPFTAYGWFYVGITRASSRINFYWNGVLLSSQFAVTNNTTSASLEFGRGAGSGSTTAFEFYPGVAFSNISLYNRALTQQEIMQNYNAMKTRYRQTSPTTQFGLRTIFS